MSVEQSYSATGVDPDLRVLPEEDFPSVSVHDQRNQAESAQHGAAPIEIEQDASIDHGLARIDEPLDEIIGLARAERAYLETVASLTASENFMSLPVRMSGSLRGGSLYYFDPPSGGEAGEWSFPNSGFAPAMQAKFLQLTKRQFGAQVADWRPNGGSVCELAAMLGTCERGDAMMHYSHDQGGHFAVEATAAVAGIEVFHFPMRDHERLIDIEHTQAILEQIPRIKFLMLDQSHALRCQDVEALRAAVGEEIVISYDASHVAGLILGGRVAQPLLQGADILHANFHKTIPGPQKAMIAFRDAGHPVAGSVFDWVCPGLQSNSHAEWLPGMVLALIESSIWGHAYADQTIANAKALAGQLAGEGLQVVGEAFGYTETHQVHVVIGDARRSHRVANEVLPACGIRANSVAIPGTGGQFGLRLGSQAMTRRGLTAGHFQELGRLLAKAIHGVEAPTKVRSEVGELVSGFPLFPLAFSLDRLDEPRARALIGELLK